MHKPNFYTLTDDLVKANAHTGRFSRLIKKLHSELLSFKPR